MGGLLRGARCFSTQAVEKIEMLDVQCGPLSVALLSWFVVLTLEAQTVLFDLMAKGVVQALWSLFDSWQEAGGSLYYSQLRDLRRHRWVGQKGVHPVHSPEVQTPGAMS